jgi:coatomer subunit delta
MVILTVGICNKNGQLTLSRQFEGMSKNTVEDIYRSFPKLIKPNQQHTYVQSEKYTFLYIPIETLYLVMVSSKNSNIIEDQETIRTIYKILCGICSEGINEGKRPPTQTAWSVIQ